MSVELEKKVFETYHSLKASNTSLTSDADIIVPDFKPDVDKVLSAEILPMISDKKVQKDYITLSGNLDYRILYLSDEKDAQPQLKAINTRIPFTHQLESKGIDDSSFSSVKCDVVHVSAEAVNSRKINIKSVVDFETNIIKPTQFQAVVSSGESELPCKNNPLNYSTLTSFTENEFEITGEIGVNPSGGTIDEILKVDVTTVGKDIKTVNGKPVVKGVISVSVLYADNSGDVGTFTGEIPFTQVLSIDNVNPDAISEVEYTLSDMSYSPLADDDGDVTMIELQAVINAAAFIYNSYTDSVTIDLYSPDMPLNIKTDNSYVSNITFDSVEQLDFSESISLSSSPDAVKLYGVNVKPYVENIKTNGNKAEISGTADVYISYISDSPSSPVYTYKGEFPFFSSINTGAISDNTSISVLCEADNVVCSIVSSNSAELHYSLLFETKVTEKTQVCYVCDADEDESGATVKADMPSVVIYFGKKGENLWDIAKHYSTTENRIAAIDGSPLNEFLESDTKLMIIR